jgi:hypothetical protein
MSQTTKISVIQVNDLSAKWEQLKTVANGMNLSDTNRINGELTTDITQYLNNAKSKIGPADNDASRAATYASQEKKYRASAKMYASQETTYRNKKNDWQGKIDEYNKLINECTTNYNTYTTNYNDATKRSRGRGKRYVENPSKLENLKRDRDTLNSDADFYQRRANKAALKRDKKKFEST